MTILFILNLQYRWRESRFKDIIEQVYTIIVNFRIQIPVYFHIICFNFCKLKQ